MKRSEWFGPEVKPALPGFYQTSEEIQFKDYYFNFFDGEIWHWGHAKLDCAVKNDPMPIEMVAKWRGLAQDPNAA